MNQPTNLAIRAARPEDARPIAQVHIRSWQQAYRGQLPDSFLDGLEASLERRAAHWAARIAGSDQRVLVAEHDSSLVGFVTFGPGKGEAKDLKVGEVYAIYLDSTHWDRGYGRSLIEAATEGLRAAGFNQAVLWVLKTNKRARRFYEIAGWKTDGRTQTEVRGDVVFEDVQYRVSLGE